SAPTPAQPAPSEAGGDPLECDGGTLRIDRPGDYRLGDCDEVELNGTDIDLTAGDLGTLTIRGDDNEVDAATIGSVTIEGQDNEVDADGIGAVRIAGDDNDVDSRGDIGSILIEGNRND